MPKVSTSYYSYLQRFSPALLRRYQAGAYGDIGRRSHWSALVKKFGAESLGLEDDISMQYKMPVYWTNFISRLMWILTIYYFIYYSCFLADQSEAFWVDENNPVHRPNAESEQPKKYEFLYSVRRPNGFQLDYLD